MLRFFLLANFLHLTLDFLFAEKYTVIGIEHRAYTSKKTGKPVEGYNIYLTQEADSKEVLGVRCYAEWLSPAMYSDEIELGSVIILVYNRFGKVAGVKVIND